MAVIKFATYAFVFLESALTLHGINSAFCSRTSEVQRHDYGPLSLL